MQLIMCMGWHHDLMRRWVHRCCQTNPYFLQLQTHCRRKDTLLSRTPCVNVVHSDILVYPAFPPRQPVTFPTLWSLLAGTSLSIDGKEDMIPHFDEAQRPMHQASCMMHTTASIKSILEGEITQIFHTLGTCSTHKTSGKSANGTPACVLVVHAG